MKEYKLLTAFLVIIGGLALARLVHAQGCESPPCWNSIPCAHCTGTWTDDAGLVWTAASNNNPPSIGTYSVSGTMRVASPAPGCPEVTWTLSGTITQTYGYPGVTYGATEIQWTASNPSSGPCGGYTPVAWLTQDGNIFNNGCNTGSGTWTSSSGSNGSFSMTKSADFPNGNPRETSVPQNPGGWLPYETILKFKQTIQASKSFAGRQVYESPNGSPTDTCWRSQDLVEGFLPYALSSGGWEVGFYFFNSQWHYDYVGFPTNYVSYYRANNRTPCAASAGQNMNLYTGFVPPSGSQNYFTTTVETSLPDNTWVGVGRNGNWGWRQW